MRNACAVIIILLVLVCQSCHHNSDDAAGTTATSASRPAHTKLDGIDISSHQRYINWDKVASNSGVRFVYIKATEGATYASPHYRYNVEQARRRGLLVGSYHYMTTTSPIAEQVANFTRHVPADTQDLIPMIDVEVRDKWSRRQLLDSLALMTRLFERHYGCRPMIYSMLEFYNENLSPQFNDYPLYIGRYGDTPPTVSWRGDYTIWQFSETGIMSGIDTYVDQASLNPAHSLDEIKMPHSK